MFGSLHAQLVAFDPASFLIAAHRAAKASRSHRRLMAASAAHSFTSLRPRAVHPPPRLQAPFASARSARRNQEDAMQLWTFNELMLMTREELCDLNARLERALMRHEAGRVARADLLASLRTIRKVMMLRGLHF